MVHLRPFVACMDHAGEAYKYWREDGDHGALRLFSDGGGGRAEGAVCLDIGADLRVASVGCYVRESFQRAGLSKHKEVSLKTGNGKGKC